MSRTITSLAFAAGSALLLTSSLGAQTALGTPFIGNNILSFQTGALTRRGGEEMTTLFGVVAGHRFGSPDADMRVSLVVRGAARAFDREESGVLDVGATVGVSRDIDAVHGLSVAASTGVGLMAWGDDAAKRGRAHVTIPVNAGVSYDLRVRSATLTPFAMGTVSRYDLRTSVNDERESLADGWDTSYTTGVSLRLKEVVLTSSRIVGEHGMPNRSRWHFSAGISY